MEQLGKQKPTRETREKKPKRVPASTRRKRLIKQLDEVCSLYVRKRDGRCVTCGSIDQPQCGHLVSRACYALRWDERNVHQQCAGCNLRHEFRPEIYTAWYIAEYGLPEYEKLYADSIAPRKWNEVELRTRLDEITALYEALQGRAVYEESPAMYLG